MFPRRVDCNNIFRVSNQREGAAEINATSGQRITDLGETEIQQGMEQAAQRSGGIFGGFQEGAGQSVVQEQQILHPCGELVPMTLEVSSVIVAMSLVKSMYVWEKYFQTCLRQ